MSVKQTILRVFVKGEQLLFLADTFIYDVSLYKCAANSYNLEDSKTTTSKTYNKESVEYFTKDGVRFKKAVTLEGAPEAWLLKNKYEEKK